MTMVDILEAPQRQASRPALTDAQFNALRNAAGPLFLGMVFVAMMAWTWGRLLDPVIDFGRELYIPWQLSEGYSLQTDIVTSYGPLSHLVNGLLFRLFGASLLTLVCVNLATLAATTALLYAILRKIGGRLASTAACALFLVACGFGHLTPVGNFNFVTPYSHEATHGLLLGLFGVFCFLKYLENPRPLCLAGMGAAAGGAFLTKPEMFIPIAGAAAAAIAALIWVRRASPDAAGDAARKIARPGTLVLLLLAAAVGVLALVLCWLAVRLPMAAALRETAGAFLPLFTGNAVSIPFYANSAGLDKPMDSLTWLWWEIAFFSLLLLPSFALSMVLPNRSPVIRAAGIAGGAVLALLAWFHGGDNTRNNAPCIMHLGVLCVLAVEAIALMRERRDFERRVVHIARLVVILFAALMMPKNLLHARFIQYGFVLGVMPAMVLVLALVDWMPAWLNRRGRLGPMFCATGLTILLVLILLELSQSARAMAPKQMLLGDGADRFYTNERAAVFQDAIDYLEAHSTPAQTLTAFPEGTMLNYLARRRSPVPYTIFTPPEFQIFGNGTLVEAIRKGRPDFVAIVHRETFDFGPGRFGEDYALDVRQWLHENYQPVHLSGAFPFRSPVFGILLLERNDLLPPKAPASIPRGPVPQEGAIDRPAGR